MHLYDINEDIRNLTEKLCEQDGEIKEEDFAALDKIELNFTEKANSYIGIIKELKAEIECLETAGKKQFARAKRREGVVERLKERLSETMSLMDKEKAETINGIVSFRRSQSVEIIDEKKIPGAFMKVTYTVDKAAIKEVLRDGQKVSGAVLKENKSLQVR